MTLTSVWNQLFLEPMLNSLLVLYGLLFHNFVLAIVVFTILVRLVILPLTLKQLRASKAMAELQPMMADIQKRYAKDRERLGQEQMRLYREHGVNPLGCAVPTLVQFPIWIGLYQSIIYAMATTPDALLNLSQRLYPWLGSVQALVPLESRFLWLDLGLPDQYMILPVLVGASMWFQQKMMTMPTTDERQKQMNDMMQWMMPLMFGFMTLQFASGLAVYWFVSNIISMAIQYFVTGWGGLRPFLAMVGVGSDIPAATVLPASNGAASESASAEVEDPAERKRSANGNAGNRRQNRRRGGQSRSEATRGEPR